ncbi:hypothetical protein Tco_0785791 [Tanacetum coccineum]
MPTEMELTLEQTQQGVSYEVSVLSDIEDSHGPSDAMHNPLPATQSQKDFVSKLTEIHSFLLTFSLRNIRVNSFTMKMEILLEPTSNKLMVEHAEYDESNTYVLERFNTTAGNPVKKILLKLNLSDHRLFKDGGGEEEAAEYEKEKEELRLSLNIISNDNSKVNYEPLSRKFPIVNWEYQLLGKMEEKDMYVYKLTRADGSSSYHGDTQAFLRRLDRQDLNDLYRLVQERFQDHPLEGHDLLLWGDLRMIFDPDEKDELWMNQLDWKLLRWKLYESCGVHTLFMDGKPMEINMLVEKKYPLIKELLEKMLNLQLEAEEERNACPLTGITTTTEVTLRKLTALENETPKPVVTLVYSRKPSKSQTNVPISKSKVLKSVSANKKELSQSWGSIRHHPLDYDWKYEELKKEIQKVYEFKRFLDRLNDDDAIDVPHENA